MAYDTLEIPRPLAAGQFIKFVKFINGKHMIRRDVFGIIVKTFALYCIVQFIRSTPAVIGAIVIDQPDFTTNKPLYIFLMSLYPIAFMILAFIFIRNSESIVNFFYAKTDAGVDSKVELKSEKPSYENLSFWIILIGIYYFISATASVLSGLPSLPTKVKEGWFFTHDPFLPQALILIMSIFCILKSDKIVEIIDKIKNRRT